MKAVTPYNSAKTKKAQIEEMFDNIAPKYDILNHVLSLRTDILWRNTLAKWLRKDNPALVLDVATGTGDLAIKIQQMNDCQVLGLDISQQMLNIGIEKIKKLGLASKISLQKGDAENLPFEGNKFDAVSVAFGVRNFENLEKGLKELQRVVKKGCCVYILEFSKPNGFWVPLYLFYFKNILPMIGKLISKDSRAYTYLPDSVSVFPYGKEMKKILLNAGFSAVEYKNLSFGIAAIYKATK